MIEFLLSENATIESPLPTTTVPTIEQPIESSLKPEELHVETFQKLPLDLDIDNETETEIETEIDDQNIKPIDTTDLPRRVHVHDSNTILNELKEDTDNNENPSLDEQIENNATVDSFLANDHSPHLPRILENEETVSTIDSTIQTITTTPQTIENNNTEPNLGLTTNDSKVNLIKLIIFSI